MRCVELFAGCGGMAMGLRAAGIHHDALFDIDPKCVATLKHNGFAEAQCVDVFAHDFSGVHCDMLCGGPPCQPFSTAGSHLGPLDERDGWPHVIRALEKVRPACFLFENVANFMSRRYEQYRESVLTQMRDLGYHVSCHQVNCNHYGVAQRRCRVLVVGFLQKGHADRFVPPAPDERRPTLRDAIADLGPPREDDGMHAARGCARSYRGRTGSRLDQPAKTVVAGGNGPGGGNNTIVDDAGCLRYMTLREAARVQTFPDEFTFPEGTTWSTSFKQIGNAVPPKLIEKFARSLLRAVAEDDPPKKMSDETRKRRRG